MTQERLWTEYGDEIATVPLGWKGLRRLAEIREGEAPSIWHCQQTVKRVRRDGGCAGAGAATAERARVRRDGGDGISRISTEDELEETRVTPA